MSFCEQGKQKIKKKKRYIFCVSPKHSHFVIHSLLIFMCTCDTGMDGESSKKGNSHLFIRWYVFAAGPHGSRIGATWKEPEKDNGENHQIGWRKHSLFPYSPVHRPGQRGGGLVSPSSLGGSFHTHTHSVVLLLLLLCLSFPSSIPVRVYLFCGVASGRLGLTQQPSIRSCAHAGRETLLLHRLLFLPNKKIIKKSIWTSPVFHFFFPVGSIDNKFFVCLFWVVVWINTFVTLSTKAKVN